MNKQAFTQLFPAVILIICAALTRFFPHPPNFTAIGAMAIFGGTMIKDKKIAVLLPLITLLLTDIGFELFSSTNGFYGTGQFFVYGAFLLITLLSTFIKKASFTNILLASIWSGVLFFIISNIGVWLSSQVVYPLTVSGLIACFAAAIPFYQNEFFGNFLLNGIYSNLFYSAVLFGMYALVQNSLNPSKKLAK